VVRTTCYSFVRREEGFRRTTTTTAAAAATTTRVGGVDADPAAIKIRIIQIVNGSVGLRLIAKRYKSKTTRAPRLAITHHYRLFMKMKGGVGEMPAGVIVISFRVRRKETEAYINNGTIGRKGLYIIDQDYGERDLLIRNVITQAEPNIQTWRKVSSVVFQLRLLT
jgi:hypothetical protein